MKYLTKEEMEKLNTKRLLAYKKKRFPFRYYLFRKYYPDIWIDRRDITDEAIEKKLLEYENKFDELKDILDKRENVWSE